MEDKFKLSAEQLDFWGSEENFYNHMHVGEDDEVVFSLKYVKTLTKEIEVLKKQKAELVEISKKALDLAQKYAPPNKV